MSTADPPARDGEADRDLCMCGVTVQPHSSSDLLTPEGRRIVERGSCRSCGLQLVRSPGEHWGHIRG